MGKVIIAIIMLIVGLGAGFGAGYFLMMPRIEESAAEVETLKTKLEEAETASNATLKKAGQEIAAIKAQAQKSQDNAIRVNKELAKMEAENRRLQLLLKKVMEQQKSTAPVTPVVSIPTSAATSKPTSAATTPPKTTTPATTAPVATGATVEYTIKEGDSLWKIAATELGNGIRYKEILKLNPTINENSKLDIGTKLILPAK